MSTEANKNAQINDNYKPADHEDYMCEKHLEYFKTKLMHWKQELQDDLSGIAERLGMENWRSPDVTDCAATETSWGFEFKTQSRVMKLLERIDSALGRIAEGTFGYCKATGEPIGLRRLDARPTAVYSIEAQEQHEKFEREHNDKIQPNPDGDDFDGDD